MGAAVKQMDPWGQVEDIDGTALYATLDLSTKASSEEIKKSYRSLAKVHHPDKGGDPAVFGRIQHSYEVLSDSKRRQVYDTWAKELQFRYVRPTGSQPLGGEDILLDEFESLGLRCDPATQLVVTCEVCRRPATKQCWTCSMHICEFCTLKRHWKDGVPLHWPLINSDHMRERLAKRELEKKCIDDAKLTALEDPNHRTDAELRDVRSFKDAAYEALKHEDRRSRYDLRLARFYMWAQTASTVYVACRVPTGYSDRELVVECSAAGLLVQSEDSPPLIERDFAGTVDPSRPVETLRTEDNRVCVLAVPKAEPGTAWTKLFRGDPDGTRCLQPPYTMYDGEDDVVLHLELPFWIDPEDVQVNFGEKALDIKVRNTLYLHRTYWRNAEEESKRKEEYRVVEIEESSWAMEDDVGAGGERCRLLTVVLARPPPTEEEVTWKKGRRQDNREAKRPGSMHDRGFRFFVDDEDEFGLEEVLQAMCFAETGEAFVPAKPWIVPQQESRWARSQGELPQGAEAMLQRVAGVATSSS